MQQQCLSGCADITASLCSDSAWAEVDTFYSYWSNFVTKRKFGHVDKYNLSQMPDRAHRRAAEKENQKVRTHVSTTPIRKHPCTHISTTPIRKHPYTHVAPPTHPGERAFHMPSAQHQGTGADSAGVWQAKKAANEHVRQLVQHIKRRDPRVKERQVVLAAQKEEREQQKAEERATKAEERKLEREQQQREMEEMYRYIPRHLLDWC